MASTRKSTRNRRNAKKAKLATNRSKVIRRKLAKSGQVKLATPKKAPSKKK